MNSWIAQRGRRRPLLVTVGAICWLSQFGCPPGPATTMQPVSPPPPPRELSEIVDEIERNAALLDRALWSQSVTVTARFTDESDKDHVYNLEGSFLFQRPRRLRMDLRPGVGEQVMQIGSNDEEFWVWIEPELKIMRWGRHRHVGKPCAGRIEVRPDQLAAALGLVGLPGVDEGLIGPVRRFGKTYDVLCYLRSSDDGRYQFDREYWVERVPPYPIRVVLFRDPQGRAAMSAYLDEYRPAWEGGPVVAHAVNIIWPKDDGKFTMSVARMKGLEAAKVSAKAFARPGPAELPRGIERIVQVDLDCDAMEESEALQKIDETPEKDSQPEAPG